MTENSPHRFDRRALLITAGAAGMAALATACGGSGGSAPRRAPTSSAPAIAPGCVLTPQSSEGPYYEDLDRLRSDITEGRDGAPLRLELTVVRASAGCRPLVGAEVDVWQCDASGEYSQDGTTFLRGTQRTDTAGRCSFRTIVPGWYAGRAPHIHFKVRPDRRTESTSEFYLPEDFLRTVYARAPYVRRPGPDTPNTRDPQYQESGPATTLRPEREGKGWRSAYVVGVA
ncbi:intradiol ring-cleavage dioxygenase [Streptomyces sp. NPDC002870]|uniref:dioxygenase family protein n=1 Tax=Streptomyces sp. NPDC002870 TaxID=3364666 RepID=UPI00369CDB11